MSGKQVIDSNGLKIVDYTPGVVTSPMTVGSVVKGASMLLGYTTGSVKLGEYLMDECIKIKSTPIKCSHKVLGKINDIDAIAFSSNVYQFKIAIKIGKGNYQYNEALKIDNNAFKTYRDFYSQFGLGVKTNIDLPVESTGYKGSSLLPGLLLNFAIGQYDTYTPIQLSQYITTIARNGSRIKPVILKEVREAINSGDFGKTIYENKPLVLNTIDVKDEYMKRIKYAFRQVLVYGTGRNHVNYNYDASGKTGTSESFLDNDNDGKIDTETLSTAFVGYMPSDNPLMTLVVTSPDSSYPSIYSKYQSNVNLRITRRVTDVFYKMYMT
jgi:cell division protein FtsI/penicillin-binding protein 2